MHKRRTMRYHRGLLWILANRGWGITVHHVYMMCMMRSSSGELSRPQERRLQLRRHAARVLSPSGTTGVRQPASDTSRLDAVIDDISGYALADPALPRPTATPMDPMVAPRDPTAMPGPTAALQQGDSPEATRPEPPRLIFAAQQLLQTLYSDQGGYAVGLVSDVVAKDGDSHSCA